MEWFRNNIKWILIITLVIFAGSSILILLPAIFSGGR